MMLALTKRYSGEIIRDQSGRIVKLLEFCKDSHEKIQMQCMSCFGKFVNDVNHATHCKNSCPSCREIKDHKERDLEFKQKFFNRFGDNYEFITEYDNTNKQVTIKHLDCGSVRTSFPTVILNADNACKNRDCRIAKNAKVSISNFCDIFFDGDMIVRDKYNNQYLYSITENTIKSERIRCKKGHSFHMNMSYEYHEVECPVCNALKYQEKTQNEQRSA